MKEASRGFVSLSLTTVNYRPDEPRVKFYSRQCDEKDAMIF